ncbi:hypothetical protein AVEN_208990-1 [Araneus ventricosus]|uniref:Tc1-like transposase DDE domain-containing protein n=1 Tax=Araneus ventricosus TaxID=182803 RepID=A0A4Y2CRK6_ARAVE|nr:hypothetical protein AVEN_208990-1 [Araneus ventricosus]
MPLIHRSDQSDLWGREGEMSVYNIIDEINNAAEKWICGRLWNVWFQYDGAPAHKTSSVKQYMVDEFGEQIIGYGGFKVCPPRSPDLTPMDFFLWGYLK